MTIAATNNAALRVIEEVTFGTTPSTPALKELRFTGESLIANKDTAVSEVIRADRQRDFLAEVAASAEGDINAELAFGDELELTLEGVLQDDKTDVDTGAGTIASTELVIAEAARTFTRSDVSGDFVADGFVAGMFVVWSGFTTSSGVNNGVVRIESLTTTVMTVQAGFANEPNLVDETSSAATRAFVRRIENSNTAKSYTFEKDYNDITQFQVFQGMRFGAMALSVTVGEIATATYTLSGKGNVQMANARTTLPTNGATETVADTTDQLNATSNVGQLFVNAPDSGAATALTTCVNSIALTIENNLRNISCVGNKFPQEVNSGFVDVTGTLEVYFEDEVLFNEFVNHTEANLVFSFSDAAGNQIFVTIPRLFFSSGSPQVSGGNEDILLSMEFTAIRDQTIGKTIIFDLIPATLP